MLGVLVEWHSEKDWDAARNAGWLASSFDSLQNVTALTPSL